MILYRALEYCARYGRWGLVLGLVAGLALPGLSAAMRPWLPQMVAGLLFITAFRVGYRASVGRLHASPRVLVDVLALQLGLPLFALAVVWLLGLSGATGALAIVLMLSAPSISGSPNFAVLVGHDPAPAMQILVVGMAAFPITVLPILGLLGPQVGEASVILSTALRLMAVIFGACAAGFAARHVLLPRPSDAQLQRLDGLGVLALAVIVVGLMAGIGPLLGTAPGLLAGWVLLVFAANMGLQIVVHTLTRGRMTEHRAVSVSLISGNRNVALYLLALPPDLIDRLLPFIGSYQLPMYLTPLALGWLYRSRTKEI